MRDVSVTIIQYEREFAVFLHPPDRNNRLLDGELAFLCDTSVVKIIAVGLLWE